MSGDLYAGVAVAVIFAVVLTFVAGGKNGGVTATGWKRNWLNDFLRRHWN